MKKYSLILCLISNLIFAQKTVQINSNLFALPVKNSAKHDSATKFTDHILGNSFHGAEYIGMDKVDPASSGQWSPIDGYKRIMSGYVSTYYIREPEFLENDDDVNFEIAPNMEYTYLRNYLEERSLSSFQSLKTKVTLQYMCKNSRIASIPSPFTRVNIDELIQAGILSCSQNSFTWNYEKFKQYYFKKWHMIYEIDIHDNEHAKFYPYQSYMPVKALDYLHAYGPFVHDEKDHYFDDHDNLEIHPAEQIWWRNTLANKDIYHLFLMSDNSGRFKYSKWQQYPLQGTFAIAFSCFKKAQKLSYDIKFISQKNCSYNSTDDRKHYLVYNHDTLVSVKEPGLTEIFGVQLPDFIDVSFEDVFIDKNRLDKWKDTLIKGYIVIKSKIGTTDDYAGHLLLSVLKTTYGSDPRIANVQVSLPQNGNGQLLPLNNDRIKVTLTTMQAGGIDDGGGAEEIYGHVSVGAYNVSEKCLILPVEAENDPKKNNLLWSSLDDHGETQLKFGRVNDVKQLNVSRTFYAREISSIKLIADLNEDDESYPDGPENYNSTTSDEEDDRLAKYCNTCIEIINPNEIQYEKPVYKTFKFASGGTEIRVNFKIERLK